MTNAKVILFDQTRETMTEIAIALDITETQVIHLALSRLAGEILPAYAPDDGPLTANQIKALRKDAAKRLLKGKSVSRETLFA